MINIKDHNPKSMDRYFFDCNVWVHLMGIIGDANRTKQRAYSELLKRIQQARATIFVNSLVLSEYCNLYLRTEFAKWEKYQPVVRHEKYKYKEDFRVTPYYSGCVECLITSLKKIMGMTIPCSDNLNRFSMDNLYSVLADTDFNDSYYLQLCDMDEIKLVTDDSDLLKEELNSCATIITDNIR